MNWHWRKIYVRPSCLPKGHRGKIVQNHNPERKVVSPETPAKCILEGCVWTFWKSANFTLSLDWQVPQFRLKRSFSPTQLPGQFSLGWLPQARGWRQQVLHADFGLETHLCSPASATSRSAQTKMGGFVCLSVCLLEHPTPTPNYHFGRFLSIAAKSFAPFGLKLQSLQKEGEKQTNPNHPPPAPQRFKNLASVAKKCAFVWEKNLLIYRICISNIIYVKPF